jgi:hypothetical protein
MRYFRTRGELIPKRLVQARRRLAMTRYGSVENRLDTTACNRLPRRLLPKPFFQKSAGQRQISPPPSHPCLAPTLASPVAELHFGNAGAGQSNEMEKTNFRINIYAHFKSLPPPSLSIIYSRLRIPLFLHSRAFFAASLAALWCSFFSFS